MLPILMRRDLRTDEAAAQSQHKPDSRWSCTRVDVTVVLPVTEMPNFPSTVKSVSLKYELVISITDCLTLATGVCEIPIGVKFPNDFYKRTHIGHKINPCSYNILLYHILSTYKSSVDRVKKYRRSIQRNDLAHRRQIWRRSIQRLTVRYCSSMS